MWFSYPLTKALLRIKIFIGWNDIGYRFAHDGIMCD